jgi:ATP-binding cassette subfamily F protein 3
VARARDGGRARLGFVEPTSTGCSPRSRWRADARLAGAHAGRRPDLLLLDEPTNHLDIESLEWLENRLTSIDAAVILVAHDRWFLEAVGTAVLELEAGARASSRDRGTPGARSRRRASWRWARDRAPAGGDRAPGAFVTRFRAGTRSRQASSRQKRL